jgi:two-component system sensor histidine kinase ResE
MYNDDEMRLFFNLRSLPIQLIVSFVVVVILTAATVGIPAIWIIQNQLDRQVNSQLDQGGHAAQALYRSKQEEIANMAVLTSQRPTLSQLVNENIREDLVNYLEELGEATELDLIIICGPDKNLVVSVPVNISIEVCDQSFTDSLLISGQGAHLKLWMIGTSYFESEEIIGTSVHVGIQIDDNFAEHIHHQSGLEQMVWVGNALVASSLNLRSDPPEGIPEEFTVNGKPYFSTHFPLNDSDITIQTALDVSEIVSAQRNLIRVLIVGIVGVAFLGSIFGALLSRRISSPLVELAAAAEAFSKGDLMSSVEVASKVYEVDLVAQSLENSRTELYSTMRKLENEREWVNRLLESIVEGIVTLDKQGHITYFSQGAERITGWKRDEIINMPCDQFFKLVEDDTPFTKIIRESGLLQKQTVHLAEGKLATLSITGAYLAPSDVGEAQTVFVFRDISEEEAIHRMLGDFLANITHEFRTPLSALAASIELLMEQAHELSVDEMQELLNTLYLGLLGLQTLVDNLLEGARIEAGRFRISPNWSDLLEIISSVVKTMQPLLDKYNQRLILDLPESLPMVYADHRRIEQVFINLLSNASKHGPTNVSITIRVELKNQFIDVHVIDEGPGIPMDHKQSIFRRFSRIGYQDGSSKIGTGFGLSIVKTIVEAHGGQVGVEDNPEGGSKFWFTLIAAEDDENANS